MTEFLSTMTFLSLAALFLATSILQPASAQDANGTYTIPLGDYEKVARIFPTDVINQNTGQLDPKWLRSKLPETIAHYMLSSLKADGVVSPKFENYEVVDTGSGYAFRFRPDATQAAAAQYYQTFYPQFVGPNIVGQALNGVKACQSIGNGCWNPLVEEFASGAAVLQPPHCPADPLPALRLAPGGQLPRQRDHAAVEPHSSLGGRR